MAKKKSPPDPRGWNDADGNPLKAKRKGGSKKKHEKAARRVTGLNTSLSEARVKLREAEDLLIAEQDRATRRADRRNRNRR